MFQQNKRQKTAPTNQFTENRIEKSNCDLPIREKNHRHCLTTVNGRVIEAHLHLCIFYRFHTKFSIEEIEINLKKKRGNTHTNKLVERKTYIVNIKILTNRGNATEKEVTVFARYQLKRF